MVSLARWCLSLQFGPEFTVVGLPVGSGGRSGSEVSRVALVAHVSRVRRVSVLHLGFEVLGDHFQVLEVAISHQTEHCAVRFREDFNLRQRLLWGGFATVCFQWRRGG